MTSSVTTALPTDRPSAQGVDARGIAAFVDAVEAPASRPRVPIVPAQLANDAGAIGAAALALEELGRM
jgi:hypothetical protein